MGIEPTSLAWEAKVLPLDYARKFIFLQTDFICFRAKVSIL